MRLYLTIENDIIDSVISKLLSSKKRSFDSFFSELRREFIKQLKNSFLEQGLLLSGQRTISNPDSLPKNHTFIANLTKREVRKNDSIYKSKFMDLTYCHQHGYDDVGALRLNQTYYGSPRLWPSLQHLINHSIGTLGNFIVPVKNGDYQIDIGLGKGVKLVGYAQDISSSNCTSFLALYGVGFDYSYLKEKYRQTIEQCCCPLEKINDCQIDETRDFPKVFICRICGKRWGCTCFDGHYTTIKRRYCRVLENFAIKSGVCHQCYRPIPKLSLEQLKPYIKLYRHTVHPESYGHFAIRPYGIPSVITPAAENPQVQEPISAEDAVRIHFGYPKIGEGWVRESELYHLILKILPNDRVEFHYRGKEMMGLELDVFIPLRKLAFEYQGEQHFIAFPHMGGEEGLRTRQKNDQRKRELCRKLGYRLIEVIYTQKLDEAFVRQCLQNE